MPSRRCDPRSYRAKLVGKRTRLLFCCPRGKWQPRLKRCSVGVRLDSKRRRKVR